MAKPAANPRRRNGSRRDKLIARVKREEDDCWLCGQPVDKTLTVLYGKHGAKCTDPACVGCTPHPRSATVDEVVPVSRGGNPYERANCRLAHRDCNRNRSNGVRGVARPKPQPRPFVTGRDW